MDSISARSSTDTPDYPINSSTSDQCTITANQRGEVSYFENNVLQEKKEEINRRIDGDLRRELQLCRERIKELETSKERENDFISREIEALKKELEVSNKLIEKLETEKEKRAGFLLKNVISIKSVKDCLTEIIESLGGGDDNDDVAMVRDDDGSTEVEIEEELKAISKETMTVLRLTKATESKINEYKERMKKEKRELERSLVSLTEENRDVNSLLRVALVEKEAVEKNLSKLKDGNEQKRVPLLQRVGFGFILGGSSYDQPMDTSVSISSTSSVKSDGSENEEEIVSLASTVERIMKNLRLEITQLRKSLDESRSDNERLHSFQEKQARIIEENRLYIEELEDRDRVLSRNVEELLTEIKETEADVCRWREACELEVEAGKNELEEREKVIVILKQELAKTRAALDISNGKLKLKEEVAATAMNAQAAAERSLQLADSRAVALHGRIEELTKQLEEAESRERRSRKIRHICWPWRVLVPSTNFNGAKRMLPEMHPLFQDTM